MGNTSSCGETIASDHLFEAAAIIALLTGEGDTFDPADARRLAEIIPQHANPPAFSFKSSLSTKGGSTTGHAAGVGNVSADDGKKTRTAEIGAIQVWPIGGYAVTHSSKHIEISLMWADTKPGTAEQRCRICLKAGEPVKMELDTPVALQLPFFRAQVVITFSRWRHWKSPRSMPV